MLPQNKVLPPEGESITREELFNRLEMHGVDQKWFGRKVEAFENDQLAGYTLAVIGMVSTCAMVLLACNFVTVIFGIAYGGSMTLAGGAIYTVSAIREHFYLKEKMNRVKIIQETEEISRVINQAIFSRERCIYKNINLIDCINQQINLIDNLVAT